MTLCSHSFADQFYFLWQGENFACCGFHTKPIVSIEFSSNLLRQYPNTWIWNTIIESSHFFGAYWILIAINALYFVIVQFIPMVEYCRNCLRSFPILLFRAKFLQFGTTYIISTTKWLYDFICRDGVFRRIVNVFRFSRIFHMITEIK